ncbi:DUF6752 domain-containing protein [Haloechinothrix salitolerans]|uniref:DUF6752 domain-containing protein n=1 Tax=Haloechinothrix salitolerans TaxID=926830 RepID=A0ABW2CAR6_9PSEU
MKRQVRAAGRRIAERIAPTAMTSISSVPQLRTRLQQVGERATTAMQRTRALDKRVTKLEKGGPSGAANKQIRALQERVASLEAEIQETRRLNRYVAEVTDVVQEVLLPAADRDDERFKKLLTRYNDSF